VVDDGAEAAELDDGHAAKRAPVGDGPSTVRFNMAA
jgi:hypothetical protein